MHLIDRKRHISYEYLKNVIYSFNIYYSIVPHHWLTLPFNKYLSLDHLYGRQLCELDFIAKGHVVHVYIPLKIKPNSVRIRSLSWQIFILPSTGFKLVDTLQHQSLSLMSNALDHSATSAISIYTYINLYNMYYHTSFTFVVFSQLLACVEQFLYLFCVLLWKNNIVLQTCVKYLSWLFYRFLIWS